MDGVRLGVRDVDLDLNLDLAPHAPGLVIIDENLTKVLTKRLTKEWNNIWRGGIVGIGMPGADSHNCVMDRDLH